MMRLHYAGFEGGEKLCGRTAGLRLGGLWRVVTSPFLRGRRGITEHAVWEAFEVWRGSGSGFRFEVKEAENTQ